MSAKIGRPGVAIQATKLVREFNGVRAVDEVDLEIHEGEIYGFLGPNGAGKSTTVRMLCTLLAPNSGQAVVAGYDVVTDPGAVRLRIGVALQEASLDPKQTGEELLRLQGRLYGMPTAVARARAAELGELIDIGPPAHVLKFINKIRMTMRYGSVLLTSPLNVICTKVESSSAACWRSWR